MLPSSNIMGANDKLEHSSRFGKKGACQWNHSRQRPGRLATTPAEHGCLSNVLQFLIANLELEFELSPKRISNLKFSNRKFMTIFQSENWAASRFRRFQPANPRKKTARSSQFLIAADDPSRLGILSDQRESKELGWESARILRKAESPNFLIATFTVSEIESTCSKQATKQFSNSYKNAVLEFSPLRGVASAHAIGADHA
jgi:hypothetical protein